jgi:hypothetical protein
MPVQSICEGMIAHVILAVIHLPIQAELRERMLKRSSSDSIKHFTIKTARRRGIDAIFLPVNKRDIIINDNHDHNHNKQ